MEHNITEKTFGCGDIRSFEKDSESSPERNLKTIFKQQDKKYIVMVNKLKNVLRDTMIDKHIGKRGT